MSQFVQSVAEQLPTALEFAGAAAGATAGAAADLLAQRHIAQERQAVAAELDGVVPEQDRIPLAQKAKVLGRATLVWAGAGLGLLNAMAWAPDTTTPEAPFLAVVVDHSGAVGADEEIKTSIDSLAEGLDTDAVEATAFVAGLSEVKPMDVSEVSEAEAFGDAPLEAAITTALGQARKAREEATNPNPKAGIVVMTNGNTIGAPDALIAAAKAENTSIFVADVEGSGDPTTVEQLKRIAKESGGAYFDVKSDKTEEMGDKITETLERNQLQQEQPSRWGLRAMSAGLTAAAMLFGYRRRREEPTHYELTEED